MIKLKPCPFCGSSKWSDDRELSGIYRLDHDPNCYLNCTELDYEDKKEINKWNRRKGE